MEINNLTRCKIDKKKFSTIAKKVLSGENRRKESISLAFINKGEIKKLNKKFRKKNKATDVLSFNLGQNGYLGEVAICPDVVKENKEDIIKVFIHGILHLCGYEHEKSKIEAEKMEAKEKFYLNKIHA